MVRSSALIALICFCAPKTALSSDHSFKFIGTYVDPTRKVDMLGFVDSSEILSNAFTRKYWALWAPAKMAYVGSERVEYVLIQYEDDCLAETSQIKYKVIYGSSGGPLGSNADYHAPEPNIPGSIAEDIHSLVCDGKEVVPGMPAAASVHEAIQMAPVIAKALHLNNGQ